MTHVPDHVRQPDGYLRSWDESHPEYRYARWYNEHLLPVLNRRPGASDEDVLRWIVAFARQEITALSEEAQLALSFELVALTMRQADVAHPHTPVPAPDAVLTESQLLDIQRQVHQGLQALMTDAPDAARVLRQFSGSWTVPTCPRRVVRFSALGSVETVLSSYYLPVDPVAMVVNAIADAVVRAGQRLRVCANCLDLFVARKRQAYCSPKCSQEKRSQRKHDRMQPVPPDEDRWYMRRKQT
jgi:hypothetical protein